MKERLIFRYRLVLAVFIAGLVASGVTAFPLLHELRLLASLAGVEPGADPGVLNGLQWWIAHIRRGLEETYRDFPFIAYGTDWLAFGHLMIALFFIPPLLHPARYSANLVCGMAACVLVIPLALICGPIRGIPFYWRLIDCSFGLFGILPLLYCHRISRKLGDVETAR